MCEPVSHHRTDSYLNDLSMQISELPIRPPSLPCYFRVVKEMIGRGTIPLTLSARQRQHHNVYNLRPPHYTPSFVHGTDASPPRIDGRLATTSLRQVSGGFWTVGGQLTVQLGQLQAVPSGNGGLIASGTTAPLHTASFLDQPTLDDKVVEHERRLALALDIDQTNRVLLQNHVNRENGPHSLPQHSPFVWRDSRWTRDINIRSHARKTEEQPAAEKNIPTVPFRVLDAPSLKDDYYCSILAYSYTCHTLAVALTHKVYLWTEQYGVRYPPLPPARVTNFVTSLAFSSDSGGRAILAVARNSGAVTLWSLLEARPRFDAPHPCAASCVAFRPSETHRQSINGDDFVPCEDLLVGDDAGKIYYYSLQWPESMTLLAKVDAHTQNICGLAWSPDSELFVSGGNDNRAFLFDPKIILQNQPEILASGNNVEHTPTGHMPVDQQVDPAQSGPTTPPAIQTIPVPFGMLTPPTSPERNQTAAQQGGIFDVLAVAVRQTTARLTTPPVSPTRRVSGLARAPIVDYRWPPNRTASQNLPDIRNGLADPSIPGQTNVHVYSFYHFAAVKAIAFAPWQPSLLATGGGSNDRQVHFFHTGSGATLALINIFSQVTSLVWSTTRREIAATFGYSQPEHEIRIAVFSWPDCECVMSIPWDRKQNGEIGRALWAVAYPGGPNDAVPSRRQSHDSDGFAA
ncbi:WD40-repeat-containing domain protein [Exophiala viscosa]|uniref:WD40-repeat-containing domain protein n=1 Tax=Exophiala viscosa TaxID=2486360 RepID=A0AAN6DVA2_9EURO|nr:WD40-repeat-containing domain protein [Exophiala viscosa]KAI1626392.1 WD40-repeat-containing domain protein [Exophiala viscosa]